MSILTRLFKRKKPKPVQWSPPILLDEHDVEYQVIEVFPDQWHIRPISYLPESFPTKVVNGVPLKPAIPLGDDRRRMVDAGIEAGIWAQTQKYHQAVAAFDKRRREADEALACGLTYA